MPFGLGVGELLVVLALVLLLFGAKRLPLIGRGLGAAIRNFKSEVKPPDQLTDGSDDPPE